MLRLDMHLSRGVVVLALGLATGLGFSRLAEAQVADPATVDFFEAKIRPVLVQHCYECHGPEETNGGLRLDSRPGWEQGGDSGPALVAGKPDESLLLAALRYDDPELQMPPDGKLSAAIIADFERWVAAGAADPRDANPAPRKPVWDLAAARQHWSYQLPKRPDLPPVVDQTWPTGPIDRFVLSRLEGSQLRPAAEAEREVLIRRLTFDLTGLPPTAEELAAFVRDESPDAYERLVERLLASPHFGERWGRHWLDVARYAESLTLRGFILGDAWRYRDYVVEAFNQDRSFDRIVREHIAGDLLPADDLHERQRQMIATTFLMLGNTNLEEQDKAQLQMDVVDEQLEVLGRAFLAQTIGCARCHDHKFDPIPTRDYYALAGILKNVQALEHANVSKWLEMPLPLPAAEEERLQAHEQAVANLEAKIKAQKARLTAQKQPTPTGPAVVAVDQLPGIVVDDTQAKKVGEWQLSQFTKSFVGDGYAHDQNQDKGRKTITFLPELPAAGKYEVRLAYTPGTNRATNVPVTVFSADGEFTVNVNQQLPPPLDGHFVTLGQYRFELNGQGFVIVGNDATDGHVIADAVQFIPVEQLAQAAKPAAEKPAKTYANAKTADDASERAAEELKQLEATMKQLVAKGPKRPTVISVREHGKLTETNVHIRGSVHNLGPVVPRGFLQVAQYGPAPELPADQSGRIELADWLAAPQNPLTARVFVNRAWHWLFGAGLVRTPDNFGTTGESPSHPELLDYLAVEFMEHDWSIKWLVRELVLSRSYRQSTAASAATNSADPDNRLFSRAERRRLEAECLRDAILACSGQLRREMGGPTIRPGTSSDYGYQTTDTRRSVYVPVLRNSIPELFEAFDFADPSVVTGSRNTSTVAPQALYIMNHPFVREQARETARGLLARSCADERERVEQAFELILGRPPRAAEQQLCQDFLAAAAAEGNAQNREELWTQLVHALFGSVDFRYVE